MTMHPPLEPPPHLRGGASGWMRLPMTPAEVRNKRQALRRYSTQMRVMDWFLDGLRAQQRGVLAAAAVQGRAAEPPQSLL